MANLYVVATPIGNLEDLSFRALRILKEVDLILCEDTRVTKKLLAHYRIQRPIVSYHQHSRLTKLRYILDQLKKGRSLALVSDAGTPAISDPGAKLISYLIGQMPELKVIPIPGPSALIASLSISGFPADKFVFLGFPPTKKKRAKFFKEAVGSKQTVVFYESPHRIVKSLDSLAALALDKSIVICRELTKKFEIVYRGQIKEVIQQIQSAQAGNKIKGEFVVLIRNK